MSPVDRHELTVQSTNNKGSSSLIILLFAFVLVVKYPPGAAVNELAVTARLSALFLLYNDANDVFSLSPLPKATLRRIPPSRPHSNSTIKDQRPKTEDFICGFT